MNKVIDMRTAREILERRKRAKQILNAFDSIAHKALMEQKEIAAEIGRKARSEL